VSKLAFATTVVVTLVGLSLVPRAGQAGTLCGTVRDAQTGAPVAHAGVFLRTPAGAYTGINGATDVSGAFCIDDIPPGTYDIEVRVDDYRVAYLRGVVILVTTGVGIEAGRPLQLAPPTPNPATTSTLIAWSLPAAARVRLAILDVRGRLVRGWSAASQPAGAHSLAWNLRDAEGRAVPPGMYFVIFEADGAQRVRPVIRIR
jgi:carboxypeptidase family protein/flagellar hook capping protein FlgD